MSMSAFPDSPISPSHTAGNKVSDINIFSLSIIAQIRYCSPASLSVNQNLHNGLTVQETSADICLPKWSVKNITLTVSRTQ